MNYHTQSNSARYIADIGKVKALSAPEQEILRSVTEKFAFRANDYYLNLIDWDDPDDPIRRLIMPQVDELKAWGTLDASNEQSITAETGVQHKYPNTALLLCNSICGGYCRYCFRKRLFISDSNEVPDDLTAGLDYIRAHPEIDNVLLTGGDPLLLSVRALRDILTQLRQIPHVRAIRIGSKMLAFDPVRILQNLELQQIFREFSQPQQRIYLITHFDHPRELTAEAIQALDCCIRSGVICLNQCPLINGINSDPAVLAELFAQLSYVGCSPYYLFQCRPTEGNSSYQTTLVEGYRSFSQAMTLGSGLCRQAKYCMSHESGKIQILHIDQQFIYLKYHQAKAAADLGRFLICHRDDQAQWFDQLTPIQPV